MKYFIYPIIMFITLGLYGQNNISENRNLVATFSIVGLDPETGELGVAVASKFFAVGSVVPWAKSKTGAVATQSFANTSFGWRAIELLEKGATPEQIKEILLQSDDNPESRQFGIVSAEGKSVTYTGKDCVPWAGGRAGRNYACQGNILTGEDVVIAMEETVLNTKGTLAERLYAALLAGNVKGGDSRGKQSAAMLVVKEKAGYGGYTDRAIDIRVDDHAEPFEELGRLLNYAQMNYLWNEAWTAYQENNYDIALPLMEKTAQAAPENPEVLYDLVVIQTAAGQIEEALKTMKRTIELSPKLKKQAEGDNAIKQLREQKEFNELIK